jgi:hypothetical protein
LAEPVLNTIDDDIPGRVKPILIRGEEPGRVSVSPVDAIVEHLGVGVTACYDLLDDLLGKVACTNLRVETRLGGRSGSGASEDAMEPCCDADVSTSVVGLDGSANADQWQGYGKAREKRTTSTTSLVAFLALRSLTPARRPS